MHLSFLKSIFRSKFIFLAIIVSLFKVQLALAQNLESMTYREASKQYILNSYSNLFEQLNKILTPEILPHETKDPVDLRKLIVKSRDMIDLFIYSLSVESKNKKSNEVEKIRTQLDKGYEVFGIYKDIYDRQQVENPSLAIYDKKEVNKKRKMILDWLKEFNKDFDQNFYFLSHNSYLGYDWKKKDLSIFYWGDVDNVPNINENSLIVIKDFLADLVKKTIHHYKITKEVKNPIKNHETIELYHDMRKFVRTIKKIITYFPELGDVLTEDQKSFLTKFTELYGKISDNIAKLEALNGLPEDSEKHQGESKNKSNSGKNSDKDRKDDKKSNKKIELVKKDIDLIWTEIQTYENSLDVKQNLKSIETVLKNGY